MSSDPQDDLDGALMIRLGGIVMVFSRLEQWLNEFLAHLLEANSALMHTITVNVSSATVTDWTRTLLRVLHHPNEPPAKIMELLVTIATGANPGQVRVSGRVG